MMLSLFGRDEYALLGFAAILDIEKIPYERTTNLVPTGNRVLVVVSSDLSEEESDQVARQRSLVVGGGRRFADRLFGLAPCRVDGPCSISLDESIWPAGVSALAERFGKSALRIPWVPVWELEGHRLESVLAEATKEFGASTRIPAIVQRNGCLWSSIDLGAAFANLLTERYLASRNGTVHRLQANASARLLAETAYYLAPDFVRRKLRKLTSHSLQRQLRERAGGASEYPIDPTGWLLVELVKQLLERAGGSLVRLGHWPIPYHSAAVLTHDLEPRRYAYQRGFTRLAHRLSALKSPSAFGLVARPTGRHLGRSSLPELAKHDVFCHGLTHRGERVDGRSFIASHIALARKTLERHLQRPVNGYRSPRLDRSLDLLWALDQERFDYDSSYPDVDRENLTRFGAGVRLNMPFRAPIEDEPGCWRPSRCLELPLTAPDCIQPLFLGASVETLREALRMKAAFVRETGGLHMALVHAGVFGDEDAEQREEHLGFVHQHLRHPETWLTTPSKLVAWWKAREALHIDVAGNFVRVRNDADRPVAGARVLLDRKDETMSFALPELLPGAECVVASRQGERVDGNEEKQGNGKCRSQPGPLNY